MVLVSFTRLQISESCKISVNLLEYIILMIIIKSVVIRTCVLKCLRIVALYAGSTVTEKGLFVLIADVSVYFVAADKNDDKNTSR